MLNVKTDIRNINLVRKQCFVHQVTLTMFEGWVGRLIEMGSKGGKQSQLKKTKMHPYLNFSRIAG